MYTSIGNATTVLKTKKPKASEHQIMNQIEDLLRYDGWFVERNNVGAMSKSYTDRFGRTKKSFVRFNTVGKSDITALKNGTFIAIEVKTPTTKNAVTRWQQEYIDNINRHGGTGFVAWSVEQVAQKLNIKLLF